ncbi:putative transcription factor C2H2 family [Medicago truncatula]|uniref:Putative transcription factor C2H2 family n=1 Tax=Medicago truncatula TaxID=3880 RepID=A0A396IC62_MEDTR|nr:BOI-related E3 ubiquitin-protein ligase 1 isoform X1 [Medicago truncatula]RHN63152.1 putative transcription factor C2H2 family [Medicago truncatula]
MAVQAQYPSNILLLLNNNNSRNGQEGQQPSGALGLSLLDQTHHSHNILCNNTSTNSRKRVREGTSPNVINHFSLQPPQPSQIIHLSQLHNHQQQNVSTGLRLSFDDQQQQRLQLQLQLQLHQQQQGCHSSSFSSLLPQGLVSQIKQQHDELDQYLQTQGENLRRTLADKRQKHYRELLNAAEEAVARRLREKEVEFAKATRRNAELEARTAQLTMEAQVWQAKARAQEAAAASLQAQLQQTIMCQTGEDAGGGVSCGVEGQAEDAESAYIDPDRVVEVAAARGKCRGCEKRVATVVVLPCRHLCVCTECDAHFRVCPVCFTPKNSTVEVFLS